MYNVRVCIIAKDHEIATQVNNRITPKSEPTTNTRMPINMTSRIFKGAVT